MNFAGRQDLILSFKFIIMRNNEDLQKDVQDAIIWEPLLHAAEIGVTAKDGIVTLTGVVDSYAKKLEAEHAAKRVAGVKALVEKIEIKLESWGKKDDSEIANEVLKALKWNWQVVNDKIKVQVENGWITLEGELEWNYQRLAAKQAVKNLVGVKGVTNNITIQSGKHSSIAKLDIEKALRRNQLVNDDDIRVITNGNHVVLQGSVTSWHQRDEAERMAWNAPGVSTVENELTVDDEYKFMN